MKKILIIIISFFFIVPEAYAMSKITSMNINVVLDNEGMATVTEEWEIANQDDIYFEKEFYDVKKATISEYTINDANSNAYTYVEKINKKKSNQYSYQDKNNKKKIMFTTDGKDNRIYIQYKVEGMISKFDDIQGLNWYFVSNSSNQEIGMMNIFISGPIELNENNTALYAIGNNLSCTFSDGKIHIFSSKINSKSKIKLMTAFNDISFKNAVKVNGKLIDNYNNAATKSPIIEEMIDVVSSEAAIILIVIIILIIIITIITKIVNHGLNQNEYRNIYSYNKDILGLLNTVPYYDSIPCQGNLYKIAFYANYYKIVKNRSNLIGAILLNWIFEGKAEIINRNEKNSIKLIKNINFENEVDQKLYEMLIKASNNMIIDSNKINRYITDNCEEVVNWYKETVKFTIKDEYSQKNIILKKKFGQTKIILNRIIFEEAKKIQGLKRYLLNFNQVPRKTELTENIYKNLILNSILLGVDENFSREILRKNPDNIMAKQLLEYEKIKSIYKNIYSQSMSEYKKIKHKKDKNPYDPTKENNS